MNTPKNISGQKFGRITAIKLAGKRKNGTAIWECICDCGKTCLITGTSLRAGRSHSCGCLRLESVVKHGMSFSPEYRTWACMKDRCNNPGASGYQSYGGAGVKVCEIWQTSFNQFLADMGYKPSPKHSIDRIDSSKDYSPENCRWATKSTQANNRKSNINITAFEQTHTVAEWAEITGIHRSIIYQRLDAGWDHISAILKPKRARALG